MNTYKLIINNFKYINKYSNFNNNINHNNKPYTTKPYNKNNKSLNIDFNRALNLLNNDNNNNHSESLFNIQQQILNCNENEINDLDRISAVNLLNKIQFKYNSHPSKLNINILVKIWKLLDINQNSSDNSDTNVLSDEIRNGVGSHVYNSVKQVKNEINKLDNQGTFNPNDKQLYQSLKNAYEAAYILGMWKELVSIKNKMNEMSIKEDTQLFNKSPNQLGTDQAYKIITNQIPNSIFTKSPSIIDIQNDSRTTQVDETSPYKNYYVTDTLFKNQKLYNINLDDREFKRLENEFIKLNNDNDIKKDNNGYSSLYFKDESFLTIIGSAVKYSDGFKMFNGIYNKDSNQIQLYSNYEFTQLNINIEEQMDLKVLFTNNKSSLQLIGTYRSTTHNEGKSYIMDMDIIYTFKNQRSKLNK